MACGLVTLESSLLAVLVYDRVGVGRGYADFDSISVNEEPRKPVPYGSMANSGVGGDSSKLRVGSASIFRIADQKLGPIALRIDRRYVSVDSTGAVSIGKGKPGRSESLAWIE